MSDESSSHEEEYDPYADPNRLSEKRYPLHDCCEFEDVEALRVRLEMAENGGGR
jgi:hypothetical protein